MPVLATALAVVNPVLPGVVIAAIAALSLASLHALERRQRRAAAGLLSAAESRGPAAGDGEGEEDATDMSPLPGLELTIDLGTGTG